MASWSPGKSSHGRRVPSSVVQRHRADRTEREGLRREPIPVKSTRPIKVSWPDGGARQPGRPQGSDRGDLPAAPQGHPGRAAPTGRPAAADPGAGPPAERVADHRDGRLRPAHRRGVHHLPGRGRDLRQRRRRRLGRPGPAGRGRAAATAALGRRHGPHRVRQAGQVRLPHRDPRHHPVSLPELAATAGPAAAPGRGRHRRLRRPGRACGPAAGHRPPHRPGPRRAGRAPRRSW